jgi:hypothetical protein
LVNYQDLNFFGEDILERDQNTRNIAKMKVKKFELNNKLVLPLEKGRLNRGLSIRSEDVNLSNNKVYDFKLKKKQKIIILSILVHVKTIKMLVILQSVNIL